MSDTLASLRHKIDGAGKLESVVRTMKVLAASSIHQYESAVRVLVDYERTLNLGLGVCLRQGAPIASSSDGKKDEKEIMAVVFGSDQGLVGRFNEVVTRFAAKTLGVMRGRKRIWAIGERVNASLTDLGLQSAGKFDVPNSVAAITPLVGQIQVEIENWRGQNQSASIYIFYNRPRTATLYEPASQRLLPLDAQWQRDLAKIKWPTKILPEILGNDEETVRVLVREYLFISLFKACTESLATENASRLAAMQRAEKNIEELSDKLTQSFYRLRQKSIDEELSDIIAGYKSLMK